MFEVRKCIINMCFSHASPVLKMVPIQTLNLYLTLRFPSSTAYTDMAVYCLFCALVYPWLKFNVKFFFFCLLVCFFDCEMIFFPMNK